MLFLSGVSKSGIEVLEDEELVLLEVSSGEHQLELHLT